MSHLDQVVVKSDVGVAARLQSSFSSRVTIVGSGTSLDASKVTGHSNTKVMNKIVLNMNIPIIGTL